MKSQPHRIIPSIVLLLTMVLMTADSQAILTPAQYFAKVSEKFSQIQDYQAQIRITMEEHELEWSGSLIYKKPDKLRIDYEEPAEQVLVYDGETLIFYRPEYSTVFEQRISGGTTALLPSGQELSLLRQNYSVAYLIGPEQAPLDEESEEMVVWLKFRANTTAEGFREMEIAIGEDGFYRRVLAKALNQTWEIDFTNVILNPGIPDQRFFYKYPANANVYPDFLFEDSG
jgi:outer membrane lipoprotein carrier protein